MNIVPFQFKTHAVRVIEDGQGEPWFVAADVCAAIAIGNVSDAAGRLDEDERGIATVDTPSGQQRMVTVNESGLYSLILTSRKAEARAFKRWITHEVLPSIRRTGGYQMPGKGDPGTEALRMAPLATRAARALGLDKNAAAISANQFVQRRTGVNLLQEFGSVHLPAVDQARYLTPTEIGERIDCSGQRVNKMLSDLGFQVKDGKDWVPTPKAEGHFRRFDTSKRHNSGVPVTQVKWSESVIKLLQAEVAA